MPPSDYGPSPFHDTPAEVVPEPPRADRFTRENSLNKSAQKIYDQLVDQRDRIAKVNPEFANKLYGPHSDLTANEGMVLMAQELAESGITDIYKVDKGTQQVPLTLIPGGYDPEVGSTLDSFIDPRGNYVDSSAVKQDKDGNYYFEKSGYVNTETGEPLKVDQYGEYQGKENILQSRGAANRIKIGYGLDFIDDVPTYFQTAYKEPSSWKRATNAFYSNPLLGVAASLIGGPIAGALVSGAKAAYGPGDFGDALKAAALSYGTSMALQNLLPSTPTFDPSSALETQFALPGMEFSNLPVPSWNTGYPGSPEQAMSDFGADLGYNPNLPPGESGIKQIIAESAGAEMFAPPGAGYDLGYALNEVNQPFTPEPTLDPTLGDPTAARGGMPDPASGDPSLGDPTAGYGGMPKLSLSDQLSIAGMTAGAGIKALLSNPVGQFIAGKALQNLLGGGSQSIQMPGGAGSGIAQPSVQYAQVPEFDVTKEFSPTLYAMRQQGAKS
jgi:hypothetical protein